MVQNGYKAYKMNNPTDTRPLSIYDLYDSINKNKDGILNDANNNNEINVFKNEVRNKVLEKGNNKNKNIWKQFEVNRILAKHCYIITKQCEDPKIPLSKYAYILSRHI